MRLARLIQAGNSVTAAQANNPRDQKQCALAHTRPLRSRLRPAICQSIPMAICLSLVLSGCSDSSAPASSQPTPQTPMPVAETTPQVQVSGGQPISSQPLNSEPDNSSSGAQTTDGSRYPLHRLRTGYLATAT